ncbi:GrpB family protein [Gracilibacillus salinarum]|uniref:GrpB family protein n=1 Tax=Gracilibacillus salinarum TaxID=2932255 RepID=A0ABY4GS33_9BACI|nr:GrpB family protein [Gracilibacillus salinarum]UOQ87175.1 GrpB family protein [Gracilibacillus salinarum]
MRRVKVCTYQNIWPSIFATEAEQLKEIFGGECTAIYHIGSTAVPELHAKPIIDIMPIVKKIDIIDTYNNQMKEIGYTPKGENGIPQRRYFQKGGDNRTHHVHIYQEGSHQITRHLAFREYLREHPGERNRYGQWKVKLANQFPYEISSYIDGKDDLVKEIENKALEWYKGF